MFEQEMGKYINGTSSMANNEYETWTAMGVVRSFISLETRHDAYRFSPHLNFKFNNVFFN